MRRKRIELEQAVIRAAMAHAGRMADEGTRHSFDGIIWSSGLGRYLGDTEKSLLAVCQALTEYLPTEAADTHGKWVEGSPETSREAALTVVRGKLGRQILAHIRTAHWQGAVGSTDDAMEHTLRKSHQSLSSARNALCEGGWLIDSGLRRRTSSKREAVVWTLSPSALRKLELQEMEAI